MNEGNRSGTEEAVSVLVVDDEEMLADTIALQLERWYEVSVAYGGREALDRVDETVDVVLLDRRMPDLPGDEVLAEIRERGLDVQVVVVTAVDADFDVIPMDCDGYVEKPVDAEDLKATVERQLVMRSYDEKVAEFFSITDKLSALQVRYPQQELDSNPEYASLLDRQARLREELDETFDRLEDETLLL